MDRWTDRQPDEQTDGQLDVVGYAYVNDHTLSVPCNRPIKFILVRLYADGNHELLFINIQMNQITHMKFNYVHCDQTQHEALV